MKSTPEPSTKGQRTRAEIVRRSAELMNRQGFLAAPVAAVVEATGIQKGGLYRHFESREALAFEALDHAVAQVRERLLGAIQGERNACDQLRAMLRAYAGAGADVPLPGGCPIMNCAIEADHAHAGLRAHAQAAMSGWHDLIARIVAAGVRRGEIRPGTDPKLTASAFIACIEGGVMLTQLYADARHLRAASALLEDHITHRLRAQPDPGENR
jgi:TetR/AcrR family transcriptional regulator, transcriptional repressor for nem operon